MTILCTTKFIDVHHLGAYTDKELKKYQDSPPDEYNVKTLNILYNRAIGICFCFLEAPTRTAIEYMVLSVIGSLKFKPPHNIVHDIVRTTYYHSESFYHTVCKSMTTNDETC